MFFAEPTPRNRVEEICGKLFMLRRELREIINSSLTYSVIGRHFIRLKATFPFSCNVYYISLKQQPLESIFHVMNFQRLHRLRGCIKFSKTPCVCVCERLQSFGKPFRKGERKIVMECLSDSRQLLHDFRNPSFRRKAPNFNNEISG